MDGTVDQVDSVLPTIFQNHQMVQGEGLWLLLHWECSCPWNTIGNLSSETWKPWRTNGRFLLLRWHIMSDYFFRISFPFDWLWNLWCTWVRWYDWAPLPPPQSYHPKVMASTFAIDFICICLRASNNQRSDGNLKKSGLWSDLANLTPKNHECAWGMSPETIRRVKGLTMEYENM